MIFSSSVLDVPQTTAWQDMALCTIELVGVLMDMSEWT